MPQIKGTACETYYTFCSPSCNLKGMLYILDFFFIFWKKNEMTFQWKYAVSRVMHRIIIKLAWLIKFCNYFLRKIITSYTLRQKERGREIKGKQWSSYVQLTLSMWFSSVISQETFQFEEIYYSASLFI